MSTETPASADGIGSTGEAPSTGLFDRSPPGTAPLGDDFPAVPGAGSGLGLSPIAGLGAAPLPAAPMERPPDPPYFRYVRTMPDCRLIEISKIDPASGRELPLGTVSPHISLTALIQKFVESMPRPGEGPSDFVACPQNTLGVRVESQKEIFAIPDTHPALVEAYRAELSTGGEPMPESQADRLASVEGLLRLILQREDNNSSRYAKLYQQIVDEARATGQDRADASKLVLGDVAEAFRGLLDQASARAEHDRKAAAGHTSEFMAMSRELAAEHTARADAAMARERTSMETQLATAKAELEAKVAIETARIQAEAEVRKAEANAAAERAKAEAAMAQAAADRRDERDREWRSEQEARRATHEARMEAIRISAEERADKAASEERALQRMLYERIAQAGQGGGGDLTSTVKKAGETLALFGLSLPELVDKFAGGGGGGDGGGWVGALMQGVGSIGKEVVGLARDNLRAQVALSGGELDDDYDEDEDDIEDGEHAVDPAPAPAPAAAGGPRLIADAPVPDAWGAPPAPAAAPAGTPATGAQLAHHAPQNAAPPTAGTPATGAVIRHANPPAPAPAPAPAGRGAASSLSVPDLKAARDALDDLVETLEDRPEATWMPSILAAMSKTPAMKTYIGEVTLSVALAESVIEPAMIPRVCELVAGSGLVPRHYIYPAS